jgi:hypothetical protein
MRPQTNRDLIAAGTERERPAAIVFASITFGGKIMAVQNNDPYASKATDSDALRRRARLDNELQPDPELAEGPAGSGRIALFAIAIIAILGVVFYGLNNPSLAPQSTSTAQTTTAPPVNNDVAATRPPVGQTTGSATAPMANPSPATPPAANSGSNSSGDNTTSGTTSMAPAPSPSNGGTTTSGAPANN